MNIMEKSILNILYHKFHKKFQTKILDTCFFHVLSHRKSGIAKKIFFFHGPSVPWYDLGVIFFLRSHGWKDFLYVCVYVCVCVCVCVCLCVCVSVCIHARGRNFYSIDTKFGTQVGWVKSKIEFEDGLCGSHRDS